METFLERGWRASSFLHRNNGINARKKQTNMISIKAMDLQSQKETPREKKQEEDREEKSQFHIGNMKMQLGR